MLEFAKTPMGKRYFERDLPALIESNKELAKAQNEANALMATQIKQRNRQLQLEQRKLILEMKVHKIALKDLITEEKTGE